MSGLYLKLGGSRRAPPDRSRPLVLQLAYGQDGQLKGFAVLEFETAAMAEEAQQQADGLALGGGHLRVSFCAPGPPGRSMLAALIAAQATVSVCPHPILQSWGDREHLSLSLFCWSPHRR